MSAAMQILETLRNQGVDPSGVSADSRKVRPGDLFLAMPGQRTDGRDFIADAVGRGAAGVLWESGAGRAPEVRVPSVPIVPVSGLPGLAGELAHLICGRPSEKLWLCGVTGTNGKTSVSQWIAQAGMLLGLRCGVIGTLGSGFPGSLKENLNTTPDAVSIHSTLAGMLEAGARGCAMEVSSIGLDQERCNGLHFSAAAFTNLTRDHLEYHGSMERYAAAKARLFSMPGLHCAILNLDDPFGMRLCGVLAGSGVRRIGYTLAPAAQKAGVADELLIAEDVRFDGNGTAFRLRVGDERIDIAAPLHGRFNVSNLLAVLGALLSAGIPVGRAAAAMPFLVAPPGRMQTVSSGAREGGLLVVVDYAHTPDALEQALTTLREVAAARGGRLWCVFGCGGDRDPGKRPMMGEVAARNADVVIVSSDNPRGENPQAIVDGIVAGTDGKARVIVDRAAAIREAVFDAAAQDVLLIAGKGHEAYQEIAGVRHPFSDADEARKALQARERAA